MFVWLAVVLLVIWMWRSTKRPSWSPKGPPLLPLVGNILSVNNDCPHDTFGQWAKRYGSIYHCKFGVQEMVVLSDPNLIREAFSKPEVTARPATELFQFLVDGQGIVASDGELWHETRRFTLRNLRNFGMGKSKLESSIQFQVANFMEQILSPNCGKAIEVDVSLNVAIVNIIWKLVASEELGLFDPQAAKTMAMFVESLTYVEKLATLDAFPWLQHILPGFVYNKEKMQQQYTKSLKDAFVPVVEQHRAELNPKSEPRDYIDAILQEQVKRPELITDWHVICSIVDLFIAGNDTTSTTLRWAFCFLCENPDVQRRVQEEIDAVIGRARLPSQTDRVNMPYTEAVIMETQRLADIVPLGLPHATTAPTTIGGFQVPAGVQVIANMHHVHYGEAYFSDAKHFNPDRFLDANGKFRLDKNMMPFSTGRRQCIGEGMARSELFLFLTSFLQSYSFRWPVGFHHDLSADEVSKLLRKPTPYKLIPEKR